MNIFDEIYLKNIIFILRKNLVRIIVLSIACSFIVFSFTKLFVDKQYQATAKMYLEVNNSDVNNNLNQLTYTQKVVKSYLQILESTNFYHQLIQKYGLSIDENTLSDMVSYNIISDTELFTISVKSISPEQAQKFANYIANFIPEYIELYSSYNKLSVIDYAELPSSPISPNVTQNVIISFVIALIAFSSFFILKDTLSSTVKSSLELEQKYNLSILAIIPKIYSDKTMTNGGL